MSIITIIMNPPKKLPTIAKVTAAISGLIHVLFFIMESIVWLEQTVYETFEVASLADAEVLEVYVKNQGYYNLFLAVGIFGALALAGKKPEISTALITYISAFMIGAAIVLLFTIPAMIAGVFIQGLPPAITLVAMYAMGQSEPAATPV